MKQSIKNYWHPTPVFWRKVGDSMLAAGMFAGTSAIVSDYKWLGLTLLAVGVIGKFLTNFFKNEEVPVNDLKP
jgi:hypothetical protein